MKSMTKQQEILKNLRAWRDTTARREGVETFRVLGNQAISDIVTAMPKNKEELMNIKGIKEKKFAQYGREILLIVNDPLNASDNAQVSHSISTKISAVNQQVVQSFSTDFSTEAAPEIPLQKTESGETILSVGDFLDLLNIGLHTSIARIRGEVSSVSIKNGHCYFAIKDTDGSVLNAIIWQSNYKMSGITLDIGMEVVVGGFPDIYKPSGRLSLVAETIELVGEGALKKAYDMLYKKLEKEGLFREDAKKPLPEYPHRIGLITSREGAVIYDFMNNIGRYGYHISFIDSRVEGVQAVRDLTKAVREFKERKNIDILVIIRGGGSLESLQAFNNETLVREIASCQFPTLVGIGHDKDVPLAALAADRACSTPTAVAKTLNAGWEHALSKVRLSEEKIFGRFATTLHEQKALFTRLSSFLENSVRKLVENIRAATEAFNRNMLSLRQSIITLTDALPKTQAQMLRNFEYLLKDTRERILHSEKMLAVNNPERQLKLGWSIAFSSDGKVVRSIHDAAPDSSLDIKVADGTIQTRVTSLNPSQ